MNALTDSLRSQGGRRQPRFVAYWDVDVEHVDDGGHAV